MATFKRRVAYLESTGTQWIDTGMLITSEEESLELGFSTSLRTADPTSGSNNYLFGSSDGTNHNSLGWVRYGSHSPVFSNGTKNLDGLSFININTIIKMSVTRTTTDSTIVVGAESNTTTNTGSIVTGKSIYLFGENLNGTRNFPGGSVILRIYYCSGTAGNLSFNFIPALDTDNVPCMYDTVSKTCFYNQGTGTFKYEELPSRYPFERLEYLKSTGTQWIDVGFSLLWNHRVEYSFSGATNDYTAYIWTSSGNKTTRLLFANEGLLPQVVGTYGTAAPSTDVYNSSIHKTSLGLISGNYEFSFDGTVYTQFSVIESDWGTPSGNLILFSVNASSVRPSIRIYYTKIYDGSTNTLLRDFIPVLWHANVPYTDGNTNTLVTPTTDIPGMYDTVSRKLFVNQGTGQFLYGVSSLPTYRTHIPHSMNQLGVNTKDKYFTIDLNITSDNLQFGVQPYWNTGGYCKIVNWGDGNSTDATTSGTALTHTYPSAGKYRVKVIGNMYRFRVGSTNPGAVIDANGNWDALGDITNGDQMFRACSNARLTFSELPDGLTNGFYMFRDCTSALLPLTSLPAGLTDMTSMFNNCTRATLPLASLPSGVTSLYIAFNNCTSALLPLTSLPAGLTDGRSAFSNCTSALLPLTSLPSLTNGNSMFNNCISAELQLTTLPDELVNMSFMFIHCARASLRLTALPDILTGDLVNTFRYCYIAELSLDIIAANALHKWTGITNIETFAQNAGKDNNPPSVTGSIATFMQKLLPNVNNVVNAFSGTNTTTFGDSDYFEIILTTTESNQLWGFTPYSSAGTWYCFDWGDGTAITSNKNLDVFTNNTRITHTFTTPGTYTIKLAMNADTIEFDSYDSDNGAFDMLGNPVINGTLWGGD